MQQSETTQQPKGHEVYPAPQSGIDLSDMTDLPELPPTPPPPPRETPKPTKRAGGKEAPAKTEGTPAAGIHPSIVHLRAGAGDAALADLDQRRNPQKGKEHLKSGIPCLDCAIRSFRRGDSTVLCGLSGGCKTATVGQIVANLCRQGLRGYYASIEMPMPDMLARYIGLCARCRVDNLVNGDVGPHEWASAQLAYSTVIRQWDLYMDCRDPLSPDEIEASIRAIHRERGGLDFVVIDHMQILHIPGDTDERRRGIGDAMHRFSALAKELGFHLFVLSQANRGFEGRFLGAKPKDREHVQPALSDVAESSVLVQIAVNFLFILRPGKIEGSEYDPAKIVILKGRQGGTGTTVPLVFKRDYTRMEDAQYPAGEISTSSYVMDEVERTADRARAAATPEAQPPADPVQAPLPMDPEPTPVGAVAAAGPSIGTVLRVDPYGPQATHDDMEDVGF